LQLIDLRAHWLRHIRGDKPEETEMKTHKLRLVSFGSAKALTRDTLPGPFLEMNVIQSRTAEG
jgi:hypothetical protein